MSVRALVAAAVLAASTLLVTPAAACWDGVAAGGRGISINLWQDASWSPSQARHLASWVRRFEALVPAAGAHVEVMNGHVHCDGDACSDTAWVEIGRGDLGQAFAATPRLLGVSPAAVARARSLPASVYTVQVFAGAERGARGARDRVHAVRDEHDMDLAGFYTVGGFPAVHPVAHILRDGTDRGAPFRVVVGAHLSREEAEAAAAELRAHGVASFVRALPDLPTFDEPFVSASRA